MYNRTRELLCKAFTRLCKSPVTVHFFKIQFYCWNITHIFLQVVNVKLLQIVFRFSKSV